MDTYRRIPIATRLLIAANVIMFLFMTRASSSFDWAPAFLQSWGAMPSYSSLDGAYWRFLTACFVHTSPFHIMGNMACLGSWGTILERRFGTGKFLLLYLSAGVFASLVWSLLAPVGTVGCGASGATNGLLGAICVARYYDRSIIKSTEFAGFALIAVGVNLLPGIGVAAHAAGFTLGLLIGLGLWHAQRFAPAKPAGRPQWQRTVDAIVERIRAAIMPSSDSVAGRMIDRVKLRYGGDMVFHIAADVALVSTVMVLFFNLPGASSSSAKSVSAATAPAVSAPAKPATVAVATPPQTPPAEKPAVTATPAIPAVPMQFTDEIAHASLARYVPVDIDETAFAKSAAPDRTKLAAAARAYRSQQFAAMVDALKDASNGDANVAFLRGLANLTLPGPQAAGSSEEFLRAAADGGQRQGTVLFGKLLVKPPAGLTKDLAKGRALIEDAAAAGDRLAQRLAGIGYLSGEFGAVSAAKARSLFHAAAEANDAQAMMFEAFMLNWALGGPADQAGAAAALRRAAAAGLTNAQYVLGRWLLDQYQQKSIDDPREGLDWLERAFQKGYSYNALNVLAHFYADTPPPWRNAQKASELADLCSGLNYAWCQAENGWMFQLGVGRPRDLVKALAHDQVALETGYTDATKQSDAVADLIKDPADKVAAAELARSIRANLKPLGAIWMMQYVGADPPPPIWASASYGSPASKPSAPSAAQNQPAPALVPVAPVAPSASSQPVQPDTSSSPTIILRKSN